MLTTVKHVRPLSTQSHLLRRNIKPTATPSYPTDHSSAAVAKTDAAVLRRLPTPSLLRSLVIQNISAYPALLSFLLTLLKRNVNLFTKAPVLRHVLQQVFYAHYCAGATKSEIKKTVEGLRQLGYKGVILNYAKEVDETGLDASAKGDAEQARKVHENQVSQWLDGTMKTIDYTDSGEYVAIKFSGAGMGVVEQLESGAEKPDDCFAAALKQVCDFGKEKGVKLLVDAEHHCQQDVIDKWTMDLMEQYNKGDDLVIYNTYQMYLKQSPTVLRTHLSHAQTRNFNFGAKIVRGAYIGSDPRHAIHDTKADTDRAYNDAGRMLATYHLSSVPNPVKIGIVLASHNKESVELMRALRQEQEDQGVPVADVTYSQLMGMADDLSLSLTEKVEGFRANDCAVYKYVTWGTMQECVLYLVRRAEENRDAVSRSIDSRKLFWTELKRRWLPFKG
ncbi:FAD-linked oxidoreductase [Saccharata proteae CBS 121410]|uniref:Proline dehydrogenase n=1 Tax=Saccharata proteae CBS 121410 TaxID=1314787 RepID=A0A9P4HV08_9PEZI|nr:FAD-linked oxidoreductase [Saccharata proteae CBS 121410]